MPVVDTAYIRSEYRNRGFGTEILFDVIKRFPNEDIGFSKPISSGMLKSKYLTIITFIMIHMNFLHSFENIPVESQGIPATFLGDRGLRHRWISAADMVSLEKKQPYEKKRLEFIIKAIAMA